MTKSKINQLLIQYEKVSKEYDLCDTCFNRLFSKKFAGKKPRKKYSKCYICKNVFSNLKPCVDKMLEKSSTFQFSTFVTGAILKPSFVDRDDLIRSKYRLKGIDSLKTGLTRTISKEFQKKTKKKIDFQNPDITFILNFKNDSCDVRSKPVCLFGRYTKNTRGFPQKQKPCENCNGKGCVSCNLHGISNFDSVEGKISEYIFKKFGATQVKITWIGGEDKTSLVLGRGRPFFAKLINPQKRKIRSMKKIKLKEISLYDLKVIRQIPKGPIPFKSKIQIQVTSDNKIDSSILKNLKLIKNATVLVHEKPGKEAAKSVYSLSYKKTTPTSFSLSLTVDGGLPIKKFVESDSVKPNISEILDFNCKCKEFDFCGVELQ
ncbi:MAG TPA: tRNA pseudouridine(54/55) synthase Pus10 [Nitrosopumilaceae archaeon]|nr:tRNA pseudouridine(54/55) synthase Pus10 [Nitrosopumilaceae archaeon]